MSGWRSKLGTGKAKKSSSISDVQRTNATAEVDDSETSNESHSNWRQSSLVPTRRPSRSTATRTAFCPCFSPTESDDDHEDMSTLENTIRISRPQIVTIAREIRSRLAVVLTTNQMPVQGMTPLDHSYPVHTTVEYTHYLVPDMLIITNAPYYWGVMDRFEAERLLEGKPEGWFLLRDSAQQDYLFSVSFRRYQRTLHARVEHKDHRFSFDSYDPAVFSASTVHQLVHNYKDPSRCLFFEPQLSRPLPRSFVFSLQHLSRVAVCAAVRDYDAINGLRLPRSFKDYLQQYHYKQAVRVVSNNSAK